MVQNMKNAQPTKSLPAAKNRQSDLVDQSVERITQQLQLLEEQLHTATTPVRERVLRRFPILFTLLTTFGVAAVFFGFERIITEITFLYDRPWLILSIGIVILLTTGTLYKILDRTW